MQVKINNPMFSVVMRTYNHEKYISQALDSIIEQEHNYTYEIIIGDDCSIDNTRNILIEYKKKYPEIITLVFNVANLGLMKNFFNICNHCKGKYLMECADDYWLPERVKKQIYYMENNPDVGMIYGKVKLWHEKQNKLKGQGGSETITFPELMRNNGITTQTICIRNEIVKKYIEEINPYDKNWFYEDYPMWLWVAYNYKIIFISDYFATYRIIDGSGAHPRDIQGKLSIYDNIISIREYFSNYYKEQLYINDLIYIKGNILWDSKKCPSKKDYYLFMQIIPASYFYGFKYYFNRLAYKSYLFFCLLYIFRKISISLVKILIKIIKG